MPGSQTNPKVDAFIARADKWRDAFTEIRRIVLESPLVEEVKWGQSCYAFQNKNVVIIQGFNDNCALMFFKGALLSDSQNLLVQMTENVQSARQLRFQNAGEVQDREGIIKAYIQEAIDNEIADGYLELRNITSPYSKARD